MKLIFTFLISIILTNSAFSQRPIQVTKISDHLFIYESFVDYDGSLIGANGIIFTSKDSVVLVDAPWDSTQTTFVLNWIDSNLHKPISFAVITHFHDDRIGGISVLKQKNIRTVSGNLTPRFAEKNGFSSPDLLFKSDTTMMCENQPVKLLYPGAGHSPDNIVVYFPSEKTLYGGCFLKSASATSLGNLSDADLKTWPQSLENVKSAFSDAKLIVPGHDSWENGAIENTQKLLRDKTGK